MAEPASREIRWGTSTLTVDRGRIVGLERGGSNVLTGFDVHVSGVDAEALHRVDEDEIESVWTLGDGQTVTVRHNFERTWSVRVLVVNQSAAPLLLERIRIRIGAAPASGFSGWCWASGALGRLALLSTRGVQSLVFSVQRGTLRELLVEGDDEGVGAAGELGPLRVAPNSREVVSLRGEWLRPDQLTEDLPSWLPPLEFAAGEPLLLSTPDFALSVPKDTSVAEDEDVVEVLPVGGVGARRLVLTGAPGTIVLDAAWAPPLADVLHQAASSVLDGAERRQGVACLDPASAVVLQRSSLGGGDAEDAIDRALEMAPPDDPWSIVLWGSAFARTGRTDHLQRAVDAFRALPARPGCGVAALHLMVAQLTSGTDPEAGRAVLARLAGEVRDAATALELAVVGAPVATPIDDLARTAVAELGAGMPGRPSGLGALEIAQRVAALRLAEAANPNLFLGGSGRAISGQRQRVGFLVQSWTRRLLVEEPTAEVLAWLSTDVDG